MREFRQERREDRRPDRGSDKFGGRKGSFNRSSGGFGGRRRSEDRTMHKVTCDSCGEECEVPFKPTEGKPVYCRDCFQKRRSY